MTSQPGANKVVVSSPILSQELEQGKLMVAANKNPKPVSSNVCNRLIFGKISRKDLLGTKM